MPGDTDRKPTGNPYAEHSAPIDDREPRLGDILSVERLRKADGRLLILYARRANPGDEGS
jgi:hypothetical protein